MDCSWIVLVVLETARVISKAVNIVRLIDFYYSTVGRDLRIYLLVWNLHDY